MKPDEAEEKKLQQELEFLYQKVASQDRPAGEMMESEDLSAPYRILEVAPDTPLADITSSYEKLIDTWRRDRFQDVPTWEDKSEAKRQEIKDAYEKILLFRSNESLRGVSGARSVDSHQAPITTPVPDPHGDAVPGTSQQPIGKLPRNLSLRYWLTGIAVISFCLGAVLFYRPGNHKPLPIPAKSTVMRDTVAVPILPSQPVRSVAPAALPQPCTPPSSGGEPRATVSRLPSGQEKTDPASVSQRKSAVPAPSASLGDKNFGIQIRSFSRRDEAEAFARTVKSGNLPVYTEEAMLGDGAKWHRVLVGRFSARKEAIAYLLDNRMREAYPGCFVQSAGTGK